MTVIVPQSELLRRAATWIETEKAAGRRRTLDELLDEAGMRFNLSPKDSSMLRDVFLRAVEKR
jgi:hypothetical protein